jgi:hypothetical protein
MAPSRQEAPAPARAPQIEREFVDGRLLHRRISRCRTLEYAVIYARGTSLEHLVGTQQR